jgi:twitching motility protein PilT
MLKKLLTFARNKRASDLHISAGNYPYLRILGDMLPIKEAGIIEAEASEKMLLELLSASNLEKFKENMQVDFGYSLDEKTRYRVNVYKTEMGIAGAFREIPKEIPTLGSIKAPKVLTTFSEMRNGLVLVCGPTGCGKSTTLAAMINHINESSKVHIITIEDPLEFVHISQKSMISHREVGSSASSFAKSLRGALREDPDVIMVGEMRDLETIELALTAAETGHLVFGTLHTSSSEKAIERIVDVFDEREKDRIASMLSNSLKGVIAQTLVKTTNQQERTAVFEVMIVNTSVSNLIKENKISQIKSMMQIGSRYGMITMENSAQKLLDEGAVNLKDVKHILDEAETIKKVNGAMNDKKNTAKK